MNEIGLRIKEVRAKTKLTQEEFAKRLGIKQNTVAVYESGNRNISDAVIIAVCREFGVSYDWLTQGLEPMYIPEESSVVQSLYQLMQGDNEFVKRTLREFAKMPKEAWVELEAFIDRLAGKE